MEACCRLRTLFKNLTSFSSSPQRLCNCSFSSSPSSAARELRVWRLFSGEDDSKGGGSSIYRHALKFQRPTTIYWQDHLRNSVSFIGTVDIPLKKINCGRGEFGVHTFLNVKTSRESNRPLRIILKMWHEMAELSIQHLKPKDFIYVSGHLGSYTKADMNGKLRTYYEVNVKEINYVAQHGQGPTCKDSTQSKSKTGEDSVESGLGKYKNRLHLWQVFFANPYEWWDNRKSKVNPKHPDFRHKDTGEALWLCSNDPPWIKRQLQLQDSRSTEGYGEHLRSRSRLSPWVYDE